MDDAQVVTPPRQAVEVRKAVITFENFDELVSLLRKFYLLHSIHTLAQIGFSPFWVKLEMISHLVGLLGLVLVKIKLLDVTRRLCERHAGTSHDGQCAIPQNCQKLRSIYPQGISLLQLILLMSM